MLLLFGLSVLRTGSEAYDYNVWIVWFYGAWGAVLGQEFGLPIARMLVCRILGNNYVITVPGTPFLGRVPGRPASQFGQVAPAGTSIPKAASL